ncbi:centrosomal protein 104kDa [Nesidiocoris tenuis]|uniref:Centrosomal protein 104kDa n=1 Tax=Nesidiocoris tenuis TaxID=355587 RepID=A0ABN7B0X5_9HEMI|nr:centrosomal protein 104kDa [Nesidiocoris tenuis]
MPRKVNFTVVHATSEEDKFRASELDDHGPTVRGWHSAKECGFPQELILRLETPTVLSQVQILAHQYLIPSRIDLWLGPETAEFEEFNDLPFEYLGYITLADNRNSSYKSRELKSVAIPSPDRTGFFKLSLHVNHENVHNMYNQVGLVAVQLLGDDKSSMSTEPSIFDDLSFEMYVDKEVAQMIKKMEIKKEEAVKAERFRYAAKLKVAMLTLREVGERLGRLEVGKVHAIAAEDYTRANRKKEQMDVLRQETYANLEVNDLLEESGIVAKNDTAQSDVTDSNTTLSEDAPPPRSPDATIKVEIPAAQFDNTPISPLHYTPTVTKVTPTIVQPIRTGSLRRKKPATATNASPSARNSYEAYDERIIPAAQRNVPAKETTTNLNPSCLKMNEREKKQASLPISVFGNALVEKFFSRQYVDKEDGLRDLECILESQETTNKVFRATTFLLHRALRDKVISVYTIAATIAVHLFTKYVGPRITTSELTRSIEKLLPELFSKSGDPTPRVHNTAVHTILSMAHAPELRKLNLIPVYLTRPLTASTHPRLALSKFEMVEQLILSLGISSSKETGMTCRTLAEFGASGLHHPAEAVRKVAERVLILVYRVNPRLVRKQLPPDDDITRRNLLYRQLMKEFDKIDMEVVPVKREMNGQQRATLKSSVSSYAASTVVETQPETAEAGPDTPNSLPGSNKQCIFCFQICDNFTEEGLNIHYWKYCPMLTRCVHCQEVLEATGIHKHLSKDCDYKDRYRTCERCGEAVLQDLYEQHVDSCNGEVRCPFCQMVVENTDASWRNHLLDGKTCPKHPRGKYINRSGSSSPRDFKASTVYN